jgi:hypothetical protein
LAGGKVGHSPRTAGSMIRQVTLDEIIEAIKKHPAAADLGLELHELEIHRNTLVHLSEARDGMSTDEARAYLDSVLKPHPHD